MTEQELRTLVRDAIAKHAAAHAADLQPAPTTSTVLHPQSYLDRAACRV